jgi:hypothetical protein
MRAKLKRCANAKAGGAMNLRLHSRIAQRAGSAWKALFGWLLLASCFLCQSAWAIPPINAGKSTAAASPTTVIANGIATSTITVTVNRSNGNSAGSGITVTLTAGSGSSIISTSPATTNNAGVATFTVKDSVVESVTYTAVATEAGNGSTTISQKPLVNFVRAAPTVAKSFSPSTIAANGTSTLTITLTNSNTASISGATFTDTYPANLVNAGAPAVSNTCGGTATATAGGNSLTLSGGTIPASSSCTVTVTVTSATAGSYINSTGAVTSTNAASGTSASATLIVRAISATNSTVTASPTTVIANGVNTSTITVTLRDGANLAVSGKTVTLTKSGGSSIISAASGTSDVNGVVTFTVKDTVAETTTYTATDSTDSIAITQTAAVTFVFVPILKTFSTSPIAANGSSTLSVSLTNSSSSSVAGAGFTDTYPSGLVNAGSPAKSGSCGSGTLSGTTGGNTLGITSATIAANSTCTVTVLVTSATAGTYSNTATNTSSLTSTASIVVTPISPTLSTVIASPTSVAANGTSTSTITVTLKDGAGNAVSGKTVSLSAGTGSSIITAISNSGGVATFTVKDTVAEGPIVYTATDTTDGITITQTASVTFTKLTAPTVAKSFNPTTIADYGTSTLTITLTNPNTAAITGVTFSDSYPSTGGLANTSPLVLSNTCGGSNPGTIANGTSLTLSGGTIPASSSCSVSVNVTAAFPGAAVSSPIVNSTGAVTSTNANSGTTASATLNSVDVSAANSTVVANPTSVAADNTTTSTVTVTLVDGGNNPVSGKTVSLAKNSGTSASITTVSNTTDTNGQATFTVKDGTIEVVTFTATDTTDSIVITQQATVTFGSFVDHYELSIPSSSLACVASTATVTACANTSSPCTSASTSVNGSTAILSTSAGSLGSTTVTFNASGVATTTLSNAAAANNSTVIVTLSAESSPASHSRQCCQGGSCSVQNTCSTTFNTSGFIFSTTSGAAVSIPTQVAGTGSPPNYYLRAVKTNTSTQSCEAAITGTSTVNFAYECNNPTTCSSSNLMSISGGAATTIARNSNGSHASTTGVNMTFDINGNAPFTLNYSDVGQVTLWATKAAGGSLLTSLTGSSNAFVVKPDHFDISGVKCTTINAANCGAGALAMATPGDNPAATDYTGTAFIKAGGAFTATVKAMTSGGAVTPNYGRETTAQGVTLASTLIKPLGGASGSLSNGAIAGSAFGGTGSATISNLAWSEVGVISLAASVNNGGVNNKYLGDSAVAGATTGPNIGRFYPDHFDVTYNTPKFTPACGAFSYWGQKFAYSSGSVPVATVIARNTAGTTTTNYAGNWFMITNSSLTGKAYTSAAGTLDVTDVPAIDPVIADMGAGNGKLTFSSGATAGSGFLFTRPTSATVPIDADIALSINVIDTDGAAFASNPAHFGTATTGNGIVFDDNNAATTTDKQIRFGRLWLGNAYGSEKRSLSVPYELQYWNGQAYVKNTLDSCIALTAANFGLGNYQGITATNLPASGVTMGSYSGGTGTILLAAPNVAGSVDIVAKLNSTLNMCFGWTPTSYPSGTPLAASYLEGLWCGASFKDPSVRATFGIFGTSSKKGPIYIRESF